MLIKINRYFYINFVHSCYWFLCKLYYKFFYLNKYKTTDRDKLCRDVLDLKQKHYLVLSESIPKPEISFLKDRLISKLKDQINKNEKPKFCCDNYKNNFSKSIYPYEYLEQVHYLYLPLKKLPELSWVLEKYLGDFLRSYYRCHYSIENLWIYETLNKQGEETYNLNSRWHTDAFPYGYLKILIYLSDVNEDSGPFCVQDDRTKLNIEVLGKKGKVVAFDNKLLHSAKNTKKSNRYACSFLVMPAFEKFNAESFQEKPLDFNFYKNPFRKQLILK